MSRWLRKIFNFFVGIAPEERLKVVLLTASFFFVIGCYTVTKELKDAIFLSTVGREYLPYAKLLSMIVLIPAIFLYSRLVDILRRYQLLYVYTLLYGVGGLIATYLLGHPTIGLVNTDTGPWRLFGWLFYFFIEGYSPFVVSVFWAFANSVTVPERAHKQYAFMVAGSKFGGALMAAAAWWLLNLKDDLGGTYFSDVANLQMLLGVSSVLLLVVPLIIYYLILHVPGSFLHGYEAVYQVEKKRSTENIQESASSSILSGLTMLIKYPYVLGIYGMIFFWEVVNVVLQYLRLEVGQASTKTVSGLTGFLFEQAMLTHIIGFFIVLFGTRTLVEWLGERKSLILVPLMTGALLVYYFASQSLTTVLIVYVLVRSINYAFAYPLRESLYIPTTKDMKFKSKSWIDAFGAKLAKGFGSYYNVLTARLIGTTALLAHSAFFAIIIGLWIVTAHLLGRRYERAVKNNEIIGPS